MMVRYSKVRLENDDNASNGFGDDSAWFTLIALGLFQMNSIKKGGVLNISVCCRFQTTWLVLHKRTVKDKTFDLRG